MNEPTRSLFDHHQINLDLLRERGFNLRWAVQEQGVIPLTAADPDFPCAPEIAEAIATYAQDRYFSYGPAEGHLFFREALSAHYADKKNVKITPSGILACDSAAFGMYTVCKALLESGDEAIILDPVDFLFKYCVESAGAKAISWSVPLNPEAPLDFDLLESLISPKTKLFCLCNPLNPTGKVFLESELQEIARIAEKHNLWILSDEIWSDIVFEPNRFLSIASLEIARERTIIVTGFSKSYGLAGLRAGAILTSDDKIFDLLLKASQHNSTVHGCNVIAQVAATAALNHAGYWLQSFLKHLYDMRNLCVNAIQKIPGFFCYIPQGCYVTFIDISKTGMTSDAIYNKLLQEARVAVVPGLPEWFGDGAAKHIRISFATSAEILNEAFERIAKVMR